MGGKAFLNNSDAPIYTPRMPPEIYHLMKSRILQILRQRFYYFVDTPIEAPGKQDFGDLDVIVSVPRSSGNENGKADREGDEVYYGEEEKDGKVEEGKKGKEIEVEDRETEVNGIGCIKQSEDEDTVVLDERIAGALGAIDWKRQKGSSTAHFAVPWPGEEGIVMRPKEVVVQEVNGRQGDEHPQEHEEGRLEATRGRDCHVDPDPDPNHIKDTCQRYIQVDIHTSPTPDLFRYELFHQSHGDLFNIIGHIIRPLGLTITNTGLYLRIAELEKWNRDIARVKLSDDPGVILTFLGLDVARFYRPFESVDDLCDYARSYRFFYLPETMLGKKHEATVSDGVLGQGKQEDTGVAQLKRELKATDRRRLAHRSTFKYWIEEYLPRLADEEYSRSEEQMQSEQKIQDLAHEAERKISHTSEHQNEDTGNEAICLNFTTTSTAVTDTPDIPRMTTPEKSRCTSEPTSRERMIDECKAFFGHAFAAEFDQRRSRGVREMNVSTFWVDFRREVKSLLTHTNVDVVEAALDSVDGIIAHSETESVSKNLVGVGWGHVSKGLKKLFGPVEGQESNPEHFVSAILDTAANAPLCSPTEQDIVDARRGYDQGDFVGVLRFARKFWAVLGVVQRQVDQWESSGRLRENFLRRQGGSEVPESMESGSTELGPGVR